MQSSMHRTACKRLAATLRMLLLMEQQPLEADTEEGHSVAAPEDEVNCNFLASIKEALRLRLYVVPVVRPGAHRASQGVVDALKQHILQAKDPGLGQETSKGRHATARRPRTLMGLCEAILHAPQQGGDTPLKQAAL